MYHQDNFLKRKSSIAALHAEKRERLIDGFQAHRGRAPEFRVAVTVRSDERVHFVLHFPVVFRISHVTQAFDSPEQWENLTTSAVPVCRSQFVSVLESQQGLANRRERDWISQEATGVASLRDELGCLAAADEALDAVLLDSAVVTVGDAPVRVLSGCVEVERVR
jgi:hypothetical protein